MVNSNIFDFFVICVLIVNSAASSITDEQYYSIPPIFYLDNYDHCMALEKTALYCLSTIQLIPLNSQNESTSWKIIHELSAQEKNYRHDKLRHGICVPLSCPDALENITFFKSNHDKLKQKISECYSEKYKDEGLKTLLIQMHCETDEPYYKVDRYDIFVALLLAGLILLVIFASFYEGLARYKSKEEYEKITSTKMGQLISCFSIPKNWKRLKSSSSGPDAHALRCINGMRFCSMILVIAAHVCMITLAGPILNTKFPEMMTEETMNMIFINGGYLIQTFLMMAGWLLCYNFFLVFEGKKEIKMWHLAMAFLNRYIRLTPSLIVVIALNATWLYHLGNGPFWHKLVGAERDNCRQNWWINLFYFNNYYNSKEMCLQQSWYLASDTQLFLVSLIIVYLMFNHKQYIKAILAICLIMGVLIPGITNFVNDFDIVVRQYPEPLYNVLLDVKQWHIIYASGYTNFGGYVVGLTGGYLFYKYRGKKIFTKKVHYVVWWILTWTLPLGMIFLAAPIYKIESRPSAFISALYVGLGRNLFALGIAIGVFGMSLNIGWFLRDCVNWQPLQVLGRLTYSAYLVHTVLIRVQHGHARLPVYMTHDFLINETLTQLANAYIFGLILSLFVELPVSALQKLMQPKRTQAKEVSVKPVTQVKDTTQNNTITISKV